ncbi:MAG TPA: hypothetical protein GX513_03905 [Firmicutes bacterium]|nr:hypothetical protein [Bacillota bacterium]
MAVASTRSGAVRLPAALPVPLHPTQPHEWGRARVVLLCQPDIETLFGILETNSANFLNPFDLAKARIEHARFRKALERAGATVIDLREALTFGCVGENGQVVEGENLARLRERAYGSLLYDYDAAITPAERADLEKNKRLTIETLHPTVLADLVLLRPTIHIRPNPGALDATSRYLSSYHVDPANNQYFMRDPLITTRLGVVIGRFSLDVRKVENDNVEFALAQLGIKPLYRVQAPGRLEGGDFMPAGDFVFQGQGLLSDEDGVNQLLEHRVYGYVEVAVVKDPRSEMDEMHLDTYFSLLSPNLAVLCEDRIGGEQEPVVDVYRPEGTARNFRYRLAGRQSFTTYLGEKGIAVVPFSKQEQEDYAPNFLLIDSAKLIGVSRAGRSFAQRVRARGVDARFLDFDALTGGYGGPHCMSQVIVRQ